MRWNLQPLRCSGLPCVPMPFSPAHRPGRRPADPGSGRLHRCTHANTARLSTGGPTTKLFSCAHTRARAHGRWPTRAQCEEVGRGFGHDVAKQLDLDPARLEHPDLDVEEHLPRTHGRCRAHDRWGVARSRQAITAPRAAQTDPASRHTSGLFFDMARTRQRHQPRAP